MALFPVFTYWAHVCEIGMGSVTQTLDKRKVKSSPTFNFWHKAKALLQVGADAVEAPAELGVAAVLVGAAGVVTHIQLVAALRHGRDAHVHLARNNGD